MRGTSFLTGKYNLINPTKYNGDKNNIRYRSSWELIFCRWCDENQNIIQWNSEELCVKYLSPIDGKYHRYFTDACLWVNTPNGIRKKIIEIKPFKETQPPKRGKNQKEESYREAVRVFLINSAKWEAAREYAAKNDADFVIITEKNLFPQNKPVKRWVGKRTPKK